MGCDIHAYIEYYDPNDLFEGRISSAQSFCDEIFLGRNYNLFSLMAGVRGMNDPIVDPRGIPDNPPIGFMTSYRYYLRVIDKQQNLMDSCNIIGREQAEALVNSGNATYADSQKTLLTNSNWHTPSWLTLDELLEVRQKYLMYTIEFESAMAGKKRKEALKKLQALTPIEAMSHVFKDLEYASLNATIAAMLAIERSGPYKTRLVFWFDS